MIVWQQRAAQWLEKRWYGDIPPGFFLKQLSALFARIARHRRQQFLAALTKPSTGTRPQRAAVPVIIVGNLAVGGAGKTPLVIALTQALQERGWRPGIISRGYGRKSQQALRVFPDTSSQEGGDEPVLIARRCGVPVAIAARRIEAANLLTSSTNVNVLIADDGLQHYSLMRDLEILVIDGQRRFGNTFLLPAGPLREPLARAASCDFIVTNGGQAQPGEIPMQLQISHAFPLRNPDQPIPLTDLIGQPLHVVAGIGNPERFFTVLTAQGLQIHPKAFPDHHAFTAEDLRFEQNYPVLMTEKDAIKCRDFAQPNWYFVPAQAQLPESFFDTVSQRLTTLQGHPR